MKAILNAKDENIEDVGNGWIRPHAVFVVVAFRTGWGGAWDAIKAAWRKDTRMQLPTNLTVSAYFKADDATTEFLQWGAQVETGQRVPCPETNDE